MCSKGGSRPSWWIVTANDTLAGGVGDDALFDTGGGNDTLTGGAGNDFLSGGAGKDTYTFSLGDGVDNISDASTGADASILQFGGGIGSGDLSLGTGSLMINVGSGGDAIHIENFDIRDPYSNPIFERFDFSDGSSLSWDGLLALGFNVTGTDGDDNLWGANGADTIDGKGGNDFIQARDGDDVLDGGDGNDIIWAQGGADTIAGGGGNNQIYGGRGNVNYLINGTQQDFIVDHDPNPGNVDTLYGGSESDFLDGGDYEAQQRGLRTAGLRRNFSHRKIYIRNSWRGYGLTL